MRKEFKKQEKRMTQRGKWISSLPEYRDRNHTQKGRDESEMEMCGRN